MIDCNLRSVRGVGTELRSGRYHGSNFWDLKGFGENKWVVAVYIDFDSPNHLSQMPAWQTEKEVMEECLAQLNQPPPRVKYRKKESEPLYGRLSIYQYVFKKDDHERTYIEALLITDQRQNIHFWGKGKRDKF